ncbi:Mor transcription activator family protein [Leminorella grimontii]|uniref:Mor transcription activator family protein n=1 Tax=Leminorella grimontii TaxID=82981 RepID=UPI0032201505
MNNPDFEQLRDLLPPVVLDIIDLIGYRDTETLIKKLGGVSFPVGVSARKRGNRRAAVLIDTLGADVATKIEQRFGGEVLYIPRCEAALREWRNRAFIAQYRQKIAAGESGRFALMELCPRFNLSDRQAQKIIAQGDGAQEQMRLL